MNSKQNEQLREQVHGVVAALSRYSVRDQFRILHAVTDVLANATKADVQQFLKTPRAKHRDFYSRNSSFQNLAAKRTKIAGVRRSERLRAVTRKRP